LVESVRATYEHQTDPHYAAARLWVDAIIDPAHTRDALIWALEAAALNPESASSRPESSRLDDMRKRGLIVLVATVPAWAVVIILEGSLTKPTEYGDTKDLHLHFAWRGLGVILTTLAALWFLLRDFISWRRQRNDRTN